GLVEAGQRRREPCDPRTERMRERLRAEAHAEERRAIGDPRPEQLVLVVQPGVAQLIADVLVAAEDEDGLEAVRRRAAARREIDLDELVSLLADDLAEELRADERAVRYGQDLHGGIVAE